MTQTDININVGEPNLINPVNTKTTTLPFNVETDLKEYSRIFITREFDPFRLIHCCEAPIRDYEIYGETEEKDKKVLFTCSYHYQCCNYCEQFIIGDLCCGYACCDTIEFQMNYKRNGFPFYTQGYNITKGCHCCDICTLNIFKNCCLCPQSTLYLRQNIDPDSPDFDVGVKKGKTETNSCCSCDKFDHYTQENNLRGQTVRATCGDMFKNSCFCWWMQLLLQLLYSRMRF